MNVAPSSNWPSVTIPETLLVSSTYRICASLNCVLIGRGTAPSFIALGTRSGIRVGSGDRSQRRPRIRHQVSTTRSQRRWSPLIVQRRSGDLSYHLPLAQPVRSPRRGRRCLRSLYETVRLLWYFISYYIYWYKTVYELFSVVSICDQRTILWDNRA